MKPNAFTVRRLLTILLIATGTFSVLLPVHAEEPESISIVRLLGAPEQYDGKKVQITGFMNLEFEGNAIYLSKADYDNGVYKNGLWLEVDSARAPQAKTLSGQYVLLEGTFRTRNHGHLGLWSGAVTDVTRVIAWPPKKAGQ